MLSDEKTRKDYKILVSQFSEELSEFKSNLSQLSGFSQKDIESQLRKDFKINKKSDWTDIFAKLNELISNNEVLSKNFSDYNAEELGKSFKKHNLFINNHKIVLQNGIEIKNLKEWNNVINEQLDKIYSTPEIGKALQELKKKLTGNDNVRTFREIILSNKEIIVYFTNIENLKKLLWVHYLNSLEKEFSVYFSKICEMIFTCYFTQTHLF